VSSGLGWDHRRQLFLREELELPSSASDTQVAEALLKKVIHLEHKLNLIEKSLNPPDQVPEDWK